ncbi:MAG: sigma-70 family RNA polymerase sigma factor [Erysipelotrichaceae bacterium]|nr:sigma-70 family RNA polymerase sigma factor [Erysipelotrichaceae bacterium]
MKQYYEKICQEDHVPEDVLRSIRQVFDTEKKARKYRRKIMEDHGISVCSLESLVNNEAGSRVMEPADQTKDTEKEVQRRILCSALRRCISRLKPEDAFLVIDYSFRRMPVREICIKYHISRGAVYKRLERICNELRELMEQEYGRPDFSVFS